MTLDELEDKFELDELQRRHEAGEKLDDSDYYRLAKRHYKWSNIGFQDFEEMTDDYNIKYPIREQKISAFKWQLNEFEKRIIDLNPNNPVEAIMIDDWNFGKKCRLTIEQLEQEKALSKPRKADDAIGGIIIPSEGAWQIDELHTLPDLGDLEDMIEDAKLSYTDQLVNYRMAYKQWEQNRHLFREYPDDLGDCYFDEGYGEECLILIKHIEALRDDQIKETQLSSLPKIPHQNISKEEPAKFETSLSKDQLKRIHDILSEEFNYLAYNEEAWLYWFNKGEKPKNHTLVWKKKGKQTLADTIDMLTVEKSAKRPIIKIAFGLPNFNTTHRKEKNYAMMYQDKDSTALYDLLKEEGIL